MDQPVDARFREITCERLVIREPREGRARAIVETVPPEEEEPRAYGVTLVLLDALGEPAVTAEVGQSGDPVVNVGHPDRGTTVTITPQTVDLWRGGNAVVSVTAGEDRGRVEVLDSE